MRCFAGLANSVAFRLEQRGYHRLRSLLPVKKVVTRQDVDWFVSNLDVIMSASDADRREHVRSTLFYDEQLSKVNLDFFYETLPEQWRDPAKKEGHINNLRRLKAIRDSLSPAEQNVLRLGLALHDIGCIPSVRSWEHPYAGDKLAESLLRRLNYSPEIIEEVVALVEHHGDFGNFGVDTFPSDIMPLSDTTKKQILILAAVDIGGRMDRCELLPEILEQLLAFYDSPESFQKNFWQFRLSLLLGPLTFYHIFGPKLSGEQLAYMTSQLDPVSQEVLNNRFKNYCFPFFKLVAKRDPSLARFIKLIRLLTYIIKANFEHKGVIVDTDMDFLALPREQRTPYVAKIERVIYGFPEGFSLAMVAEELARTQQSSCFGLPLVLTSNKLIIKLE